MNLQPILNAIQRIGHVLNTIQTRLQTVENEVLNNDKKDKVDEDVTLVYNGQKEQSDLKEQLDETNQRIEYLESQMRDLKKNMSAISKPVVTEVPQTNVESHHSRKNKNSKKNCSNEGEVQ